MNTINELYKEFDEIKKLDKQKRGYALEKCFVDLMKVSQISVIESFKTEGEQIDGAIKYDAHYHLVEIKWKQGKIPVAVIYEFRGKVEGKYLARGIFISIEGYSDTISDTITRGKELNTILLDGKHLDNVLTEKYSFSQLLDYAIFMASTKGEIYCPHDIPTQSLKPTIISTPNAFKTLESVLNRSSEFFPNRNLFDENLIYFTKKEHDIMVEIQSILLSNTEDRMYLLYGDPASGKTVMGLAIAKSMEKNGYGIFYYKLTNETNCAHVGF
jgi:hypothetical protein